jgi:hypothetical protein
VGAYSQCGSKYSTCSMATPDKLGVVHRGHWLCVGRELQFNQQEAPPAQLCRSAAQNQQAPPWMHSRQLWIEDMQSRMWDMHFWTCYPPAVLGAKHQQR